MKRSIYLFFVIFAISTLSCNKDEGSNYDVELQSNPDVDTYIALLKTNQYDSQELPAFTEKDIPALLIFRNESQTITNFPHNGLSSFYGPECELGVYVLWTIESIRAVAIDSKYLSPGRFPSLNPILALRNAEELELVSDNESHEVAAEAYFEWWASNRHKDFNDYKIIDPLIETDYRWH